MRMCIAAALALVLSGCGLQIPADPERTMDRVEGGTLRVGVTDNPPWVNLDDAAHPSGTEPALLEAFARRHGAEVRWTPGSETQLLNALDAGELDVVIGGFLDDTVWEERGALTRPYLELLDGKRPENHVMVARMGENQFLVTLETFLLNEAQR